MVKETWNQLLKNQDVRQNLSKLRQEIREGRGREELLSYLAGTEDILTVFLKSEDAKTRKNAVLLMGDIGKQEYLEPLFEAYRAELQLFVRSAYLTAIKNLDYREYLDYFKERLEELSKAEAAVENQKHVTEEIREAVFHDCHDGGCPQTPFSGMGGNGRYCTADKPEFSGNHGSGTEGTGASCEDKDIRRRSHGTRYQSALGESD